MARADRAAIFAPFNALEGLYDAIAAKERIEVEKSSLSEEMLEFLDYKLSSVSLGDIITIIYYTQGAYIQKTGKVSSIDKTRRIITLVTTQIPFDNIKDIIL